MSEHLESYPSYEHQKPVRRTRLELKKNISPKLNEAKERNYLEEFAYLYNFTALFSRYKWFGDLEKLFMYQDSYLFICSLVIGNKPVFCLIGW